MLKRISIALLVAVVLTLGISAAALADDPTETHLTWTGGGTITGNVDCGDSNAGFTMTAATFSGSWDAIDSNNNPYGYGVDSFSSTFLGTVNNGTLSTGMARVNSYSGMYGNGGQLSGLNVGTDGTASAAFRSTTNYAELVDCTYGYQLAGGHDVDVTGADSYMIDRYILDGRGNQGEFYAIGAGDATLDCMSAEASGGWDLKLGRGAGCYTDASYTATGAGYVDVTGTGNNSVTFNGMGVTQGGGTLDLIANWLGSISISDFSLTAN
jgi:hypothetical protein